MTTLPTTTLNTGVKMPVVGFGAYQIPDVEICEAAVVGEVRVRTLITALEQLGGCLP